MNDASGSGKDTLMKRTFFLLLAAIGAFALTEVASRAQAPSAAPPQTPVAQAPAMPAAPAGRGEGAFNPEISNERRSVLIDQFIGSPVNSTGHLSHGGLLTRSILRSGNPNVPGPPGAVLEYRTQLATAMLMPKNATALMSINNQFLFYVVSGEGRLDDGKNYWDVREGTAILIPPDVQRRFTNSSNDALEMVMVEWPANAQARKDILVRDANRMPYCEENAHWNNMSRCLFTADDGMTGRVLLVMLMPFTMAAPHTHNQGTEEIWTKLTPGTALMLLGSELREMPQFSAFLAPPNGVTWHGQINTSKTQVEKWLYVAGGGGAARGRQGGAPGAAQAPAGGRGRGGPANPNLLSRDPAAIEQATVKPTPLR